MRLAQISRETRTQREAREAVGAKSLARLSGFAPPTLHALGSRAAIMLPSDSYDLVVTNAPGPQHGMFWGTGASTRSTRFLRCSTGRRSPCR